MFAIRPNAMNSPSMDYAIKGDILDLQYNDGVYREKQEML